jgi:hypothetical protein
MITFDIPEAGDVQLKLYTITGQRVMTLIDGQLGAGHHEVALDASSLAGGIYFYELRSGKDCQVRKMLVIR